MLSLSVCPLRGSQLPQRGSQETRRSQYANLQFYPFTKQILPVCFHRLSQKSPERGASAVNSFEILKSAEFYLLSRENMIKWMELSDKG